MGYSAFPGIGYTLSWSVQGNNMVERAPDGGYYG